MNDLAADLADDPLPSTAVLDPDLDALNERRRLAAEMAGDPVLPVFLEPSIPISEPNAYGPPEEQPEGLLAPAVGDLSGVEPSEHGDTLDDVDERFDTTAALLASAQVAQAPALSAVVDDGLPVLLAPRPEGQLVGDLLPSVQDGREPLPVVGSPAPQSDLAGVAIQPALEGRQVIEPSSLRDEPFAAADAAQAAAVNAGAGEDRPGSGMQLLGLAAAVLFAWWMVRRGS